jgi:hypothetical protein
MVNTMTPDAGVVIVHYPLAKPAAEAQMDYLRT